jgi:hypothetical protein
MMWSEHITNMGDRKCGYTIFMGNPEGTMPLGRPRRRWKDNIKIEFKGTGRLQRSRIRFWGRYLGLGWTKYQREWRRLHNEKLYGLYSLTNVVRMIKSRKIIEKGNCYVSLREEIHTVFLVGTPDWKRQLGKTRWRREESIKTFLQDELYIHSTSGPSLPVLGWPLLYCILQIHDGGHELN